MKIRYHDKVMILDMFEWSGLLENTKLNPMGTKPMLSLIAGMSLPAMMSMLVQALYNVVDSYFVAKVSEDALTAVSLVFPVQNLLIAVAIGTGVGLNSLISRRLGEGRLDEARSAATHGLLLAVVNWLLFALIGLFASRPFCPPSRTMPLSLRWAPST